MQDNKKKSKKGFASMPEEEQERLRKKSLETRRRNAREKKRKEALAKKKRDEAQSLLKQAEILQQEADELDGQSSSEKRKEKLKADLTEQLTKMYGANMNPHFIQTLINYAVANNLSAEEVSTPSHAALDILHNPNSTNKEIDAANKTLIQFESAKPVAKEDDGADRVGTVEEEMTKLQNMIENSSPRS